MNDSDAYLPPWEGPAILLVDLDAFFASVEQLDHPAWRGKPVIVGGDADAHGVVSTCSYEARAFGVRSAMASSLARALCPEAIWTHGHFHRYREVSAAIMAILRDETPHVQQVSIDEAFMDVTPTAVNTEHPVLVAQRIQERVTALGVTCSIGVGTSKSVAKIASDRDKPRGLTVVFPGTEAAFLEKLPVRTLSGVGAAAERTLLSHGVRTLGAMGRADGALLRKIFGKNGEMMRDRALGRDRSEVAEDDEVKSVSNEVTYAHDLETREDIMAALSTISAKVGRRLRRKGLKGRTVAVKMRYDNRTTRSAQCALVVPTDDDIPSLIAMLVVSLISWVVVLAAYVVALVVCWARALQLYIMAAFAPIPLAFLGMDATRQIGLGYLKSFGAVCIAGVIILVLLISFPLVLGGLTGANPGTGTPADAVANGLTYALQYLAMCVLLILALVKSGSWARDIVSGF